MAAHTRLDQSFGVQLKKYRNAAGLTQEALAERAGLSLNAISALERGERRYPYARTVQMLADALRLRDDERQELAASVPSRTGRPLPDVASSHLIPMPTTPLFGRDREVAAIVSLMQPGGVRLLTLTGPGGVGKTRLALQAVMDLRDNHVDGAWFISLASISDPALVTGAFVQSLNLRGAADMPPRDVLIAFLGDRDALLLVDNFEQVPAAAPVLADILAQCPKVRMIVTSRLSLRLDEEQEFPVPPLELPAGSAGMSPEELADVPAVALFVQRARAVRPTFAVTPANAAAIANLCAWLDGLPLAIELAAARSRLLSPQAMLGRLTPRLGLLTGGGPDRPARLQTMRGAIGWSFDHLGPGEQVLFRRLSVFVGGCMLDAIGPVAGDARSNGETDPDLLDRLEALVDHSLVLAEETAEGDVRLRMLETIREYGLEELAASGEEPVIRRAHATCMLNLAMAARADIEGPARRAAHARIARELDNVRAALTWLLDSGDAETQHRLGNEMARFWIDLGYISEGREWITRGLAMTGPVTATVRVESLYWAAGFANLQDDTEQAGLLATDALALARQQRDVRGIAGALTQLAWSLPAGEIAEAEALAKEALALFDETGDRVRKGMALHQLGTFAHRRHDDARAIACHGAALTIWRQLDHPWGVPAALRELAECALSQGDLATARDQYQESLRRWRHLGERLHMSGCLQGLAQVALASGDGEAAVLLVGVESRLNQAMGYVPAPNLLAALIDDVQSAVGADRFAALWDEAQSRSIDALLDDMLLATPPRS